MKKRMVNEVFPINIDDITCTTDVRCTESNQIKYCIATHSDVINFVNQKVDSCTQNNSIVQSNANKIVILSKIQSIINVMYISIFLICITLYFTKIIPITSYNLIVCGSLFIKFASSIIFSRIRNASENKINYQIQQEIHAKPHMNLYNIHIVLPHAEQEPYVKIIKILEQHNIHFPDTKGLDIRDKIDFLKKVVEYTNDGFSISCIKGEDANDITGNL